MFEEFQNPGMEYRGAPFWVWNTKLDKELLLRQIPIFREMGFGGYHIHVRVGMDTPYLEEEFLELVEACVEKGKEFGLRTCLYDEDRWPSGFAGGKVTADPKYRMQHLLFTRRPYEGEPLLRDPNRMANFAVGVRSENGTWKACLDVVLGEDGTLKSCRRIGAEEKAEGEKWYAYVETNPVHSWYNDTTYVDVLSVDAINCFLENTHERYRERLGKDFGSWIPSIFTDEPHMLYKTNLKNPWDGPDLFLPWTDCLAERFLEETGQEIWNCLPELFWEKESGEASPLRYAYHRITADLFEEAYGKTIGNWCRKNGIAFTGHYLYEETLFLQNRSDGDLMRMYRQMDIPGMDLLFDEVDLTTGKQIQSVVRQYGKKGAASEEYGVTNWAFDFRGYKFQGDWQAALGITLRVPHLSMMTLEGEAKRDFPASLFYQAPWYREFSLLEDHFARIQVVLSRGKSGVRLGVIHPLESYWLCYGPESQTGMAREELDTNFRNLIRWLLTNGIDFDYLSEGLLEEWSSGASCPLQVGEMAYTCIVVPGCVTLRRSTWEILEAFAQAGGQILNLGRFPEALDGRKEPELPAKMKKIAGWAAFEKYPVLEALKDYREIQLCRENGERCETYIHQMKWIGSDAVLFLAPVEKPENRDLSSFEDLVLTLDGEFEITLLDTMTGEQKPLSGKWEQGRTILRRRLYGYDTLLLYLKKRQSMEVPKEAFEEETPWRAIPVPLQVPYRLEEPNVLVLDRADVFLDGERFCEQEEILRIDTRLREYLEMPLRTFSMAQPYTREKKKREHLLRLRYVIRSEVLGKQVRLALEQRAQTTVFWNGKKISGDKTGWYLDEKIETTELGSLRMGENILELELPFGEDVNLEAVYLLGSFGVQVCGADIRITELPEKLSFASLTEQKLSFYGGNVRYCMKVDCPEGRMKMKVNQYRGALIGVFVDGERKGSIILPPYELEITGLAPGMHEVELCLFGNRCNTLSHFHCTDSTKECNSFPNLWRTRGESWSYGYHFGKSGILKEPEFFMIGDVCASRHYRLGGEQCLHQKKIYWKH